MNNPRPKGRGGRAAKRINADLRREAQRYAEGILSRPEDVRERIRAEREAANGSHTSDNTDAIPLPLSVIRMDGGTQPRAVIDLGTIDEYAEAMRGGVKFPAVVVFYDGQDYWLADGFHRINAAIKAGLREFSSEVHQGTRRDAVLFSAGANATHGLRRTDSDKRRAVLSLLHDEDWAQWSDYRIAAACHVSRSLVQKLRSSLATKASERTYTTRHGTVTTMDTANIGKLQGDVIVKPAPPANLPTPVQDALDGGLLAVASAAPLSTALVSSEGSIANAALHYGLIDAQLIRLLNEKRDSDTVREVLASGWFHYGDEHDRRNKPLNAATTALDLAQFLRFKEMGHRRAAREAKDEAVLAKAEQLANDTFSVVLADPPWAYDNNGLYGAAERHYATLPLEQLWQLPEQIGLSVADESALFLWSPAGLLPDAIGLMSVWGFDYKTCLVWVKDKSTYGRLAFYLQTRHELLLLGTRGAFRPFFQPDSIIDSPRGRHSAKPAGVYGLIEAMYPRQHYVELFARDAEERQSWTFWGDQANASS